jgi:hypothetical protein
MSAMSNPHVARKSYMTVGNKRPRRRRYGRHRGGWIEMMAHSRNISAQERHRAIRVLKRSVRGRWLKSSPLQERMQSGGA